MMFVSISNFVKKPWKHWMVMMFWRKSFTKCLCIYAKYELTKRRALLLIVTTSACFSGTVCPPVPYIATAELKSTTIIDGTITANLNCLTGHRFSDGSVASTIVCHGENWGLHPGNCLSKFTSKYLYLYCTLAYIHVVLYVLFSLWSSLHMISQLLSTHT